MPRHLLYLIVFIEGFCSLGAEVIALRRLVPHVGSAIVITAPTIGLFLLALALGYAAGARVSERFTAVVARNFLLLSALLVGLGLARVTVDELIAHLQPAGWPTCCSSAGCCARWPGCSGRPCRCSPT